MKSCIIAKFGGSAFGVDGSNIPTIINRIKDLRNECDVGPVVVVSAPKTTYKGKSQSLTDVGLDIGNEYANFNPVPIDPLFKPYQKIIEQYVSADHRKKVNDDLYGCLQKVKHALNQALENRRFVDVNRARVLAYSGEYLMTIIMSNVLKGQGLKSSYPNIEEWPIITDTDFESANFSLEKSRHRLANIIADLKKGLTVVIGGYIGVSEEGVETTYERGGSDRTAVDLGVLLQSSFDTMVDFEKDDIVRSADPGVVKEDVDEINYLSYNEANLAGRFGMKIIDPSAIRDMQDSGFKIKLMITDTNNSKRLTYIQENVSAAGGHPVKIIAGKKNCAIMEFSKDKRNSLEDYLKKVKRHYDFIELRPYEKEGVDRARYLFLDGAYAKRHEKEMMAYDPTCEMIFGLGSVTLVGDAMGLRPGIAANTFKGVFNSGINVQDADIQGPTSSILLVVKNNDVDETVRAIHALRKDMI